MLKLPQSQRVLSRITFLVASVLGMLLLAGSPALAAGANLRPASPQTSAATGDSQSEAKVAAGTTSDTYAERETGAKDLEQFSGGGAGIYIGGSTVGVVLLIVLLILIL
jgi:hypothetical protein